MTLPETVNSFDPEVTHNLSKTKDFAKNIMRLVQFSDVNQNNISSLLARTDVFACSDS